jgi:N-methylhydantoinase A
MRLGVDTGGTFTDFVLLDDNGQLRVHKVLSTPEAPERAILRGIVELGLGLEQLQLVHGSTVATNAVLEGKGVDTLYITNRGFADLLSIGRQQRAALYDLQPAPEPPPVAPDHCIETGGRIAADGRLLEPLTDQDLDTLREVVARLRPRAVAVNLLFSYLDDAAERRIAAAMPGEVFVSLSSRVLPEIREYERGMATWLNAWIGPRVAGYLARLGTQLAGVPISVMQSAGDTVAADQAAAQAVRMLLSGPAGGLIAAQRIGAAGCTPNLLTFDMGGTSTDVALVDGVPRLTTEGHIGRFPVAVPMVDMHSIGAGGGSVAWLDSGGMLQVGPESAGAEPGPASYGKGGVRPTVTDANLVLGRLLPQAFLGGGMSLDTGAARHALAPIAAATGQSVAHLALDVVAVANEHMAQALRAISIKRGADPAEHVLLSFGGAGGLHVCALAEALGMRRAMVPMHGGVLSALGMLAARPGRQLSRSHVTLLERVEEARIGPLFEDLRQRGLRALQAEGFAADTCDTQASADLRYAGQSYTLDVPWTGVAASTEAFHQRHAQRYGHRLALPVELVNLRLAVRGPALSLELPSLTAAPDAAPFSRCQVVGFSADAPAFWRHQLAPRQRISGPALVCETVATTWLAAGWSLTVDAVGHLLLSREPDAAGADGCFRQANAAAAKAL